MCHKDDAGWTSTLSCVSDIVVNNIQQAKGNTSTADQQQCKFSASTTNAIDIYKRLCIIYFCDEREATQVASITFSNDGVRLVNMGASAGEEALPTSIFLPRSVFVLYNVYPSEGEKEVQILVNFSTLMDFLECALVNIIQEDSVYPLHIVLDTWLYVSLQRSPTICDLDKAMSTSLASAIQRFCLIPTECFGGSQEENQTVPSGDQTMRESNEMMDNTILMLHPLNPKYLDPSCLLPFTTTHTLSKFPKQPMPRISPRSHRVPHTPTPSTPTTPLDSPRTPRTDADQDAENPRKRLRTTSDQINLLEEWFQREPLPTRKVREEMLLHLDGSVSLRQLEVWFQNRRAKQKKAEARAQKSRAGEVPSATPPSSPSSPPTPSSAFFNMAPNPSALIPPTSPAITPRKPRPSRSSARKKINSQGISVSSPRATSPLPSSPLPSPLLPSSPISSNGSPVVPTKPTNIDSSSQ